MADLLEEAVADAEKLQEAAKESAKAEVLEKHHQEVKEKEQEKLEEEKSKMLNEQPEDEMDLGGDEEEFELDDEEFGLDQDESGLDDQVPDAAAEGESLCPDEGEEVTISFDELAQKIEDEPEESHEEAAQDVAADEEGMLEGEMNEDFEIDMEPTKSGNTERPNKEKQREKMKDFPDEDPDDPYEPDQVNTTDNAQVKEPEEEVKDDSVNVVQIDEHNEIVGELESKIQTLEKQVQSLKEGHEDLKDERDELRSKLLEQNKKLKEVNKQRAQLYYQNEVLESSSLNERQKRKLASTLDDADSAKEAKLIYENVTKAVENETGKPKDKPDNRSEAADLVTPDRLKVPSTETRTRESKSGLVNESEKKDLKKRAGLINESEEL